jgi:hypothetical protein
MSQKLSPAARRRKGIGPRGLGASPLKQVKSKVSYSQNGNHFSEDFESKGPNTIQGKDKEGNYFSYTVNRDKKGSITSGVYEDGNFNPVLEGEAAANKYNELKNR